jgi:O-acetyl-ADP-ribose deacetylase (regulator of RNase III)
MLIFTTGDMFECDIKILVNPVNCVGVMGKGLALTFKSRYPTMFTQYKNTCLRKELIPGKLHIWTDNSGIQIINFPTKIHWRDPSQYSYIESGLIALRNFLIQLEPTSIAIPPLGCGLGGLKWDKVKQMLVTHLEASDMKKHQIYVFTPTKA